MINKIALFVALYGTVAAAQSNTLPSVFGQPLGTAPAFPKCSFKIDDPICISGDAQRVSVLFPVGEYPEIITAMDLILIEGSVESITIETTGHAHRSQIIQALTAKFGRPSSIHSEGVAPQGIEIDEVAADWRRPGYTVSYESIDGDMQHGSIWVRTTKGLQAEAAAEAKRKAQVPKL